jgi:uncharacterized protein with von Willebrand factor type A (vWA) domain
MEADMCYRMMRWPRMMFKREANEDGHLKDAIGMREEPTWPAFARELFGRLYDVGTSKMPEPNDGCDWAEELHGQCDSLPEWKQLESRVGGDPWRSAIGAGTAASILSQRVPELPKEDLGALQGELDILDEMMSKDGKRRASPKLLKRRGEVQGRVNAAKQAAQEALQGVRAGNGFNTRSALRQAAQEAAQRLDEVDEALATFGAGSERGELNRRQIATQVAKDARLRRIALLAGRLRVQAIEKQRTKVSRGVDEIADVSMGSDLQRLLPSEMVHLTSSTGTALLFRKLLEDGALQYHLKGRERRARGPILFAIDTSGSMGANSRDEWAAACALAIMEIARRQKRKFAVVYYDVHIKSVHHFDNPNNVAFTELVECLGVMPSGGTNIANALTYCADLLTGHVSDKEKWGEGERADVILVTDGDDSSNVKVPAKRIKDHGAALYTIAIQCEPRGDLVGVSDEVVRMRSGELQTTSSKLDGVFSI